MARLETKKAKGRIGSWFAEVDGRELPCIHKHWLTAGMKYHDPFRRHDGASGDKIQQLVDAIASERQVILTDDEPDYDAAGEVVGFKRTRYIGVFAISDIEYDHEHGLRFNLTDRVCNLK